MTINGIFMLAAIIFGAVLITAGICLLTVSMPRGGLRSYRISRRSIAAAYLISGTVCFFGASGILPRESAVPVMSALVFFIISLQTVVYTYSLAALFDPSYPAAKGMLRWFLPAGVVSAGLALCLVFGGPEAFRLAMYVSCGLYMCGTVLCAVFLGRRYRAYMAAAEGYFAGGEPKKLRWTGIALCASLCINVMILAAMLVNYTEAYWIFAGLSVAFQVYFAVRYIGYPRIYGRLAPVLEPEPACGFCESADKEDISGLVGEWIDRKGFARKDVTLDGLADEIGTDRVSLYSYIGRQTSRRFKTWIGELRVDEAKEIIIANPELPLEQVGDMVGIGGRASFFRDFTDIAGESPRNFRDRMHYYPQKK